MTYLLEIPKVYQDIYMTYLSNNRAYTRYIVLKKYNVFHTNQNMLYTGYQHVAAAVFFHSHLYHNTWNQVVRY